MEFKKIALVGVGAVGSYVLWGLFKKTGINVYVVAEGERKARYEKNGFVINGIKYQPEIKTPAEARGADLVIVSTKYQGLPGAIDAIEQICGDHTTVMSLMNGINSEELIGKRIGMERMVYSVIKVQSTRNGNMVTFDPNTTIGIIYGEKEQNCSRCRMEAMAELFKDSGVKARESDVILSEIWAKFRLNVSMNLPQAMLSVGIGAYRDSEHMRFLKKKLKSEVELLAEAQGIDISLAEKSSGSGSPALDSAKYSTLQDLEAKRHTEIDMFSGEIVELGKKLGIPTPYNEFAYHVIKIMEEKNDGLFDYN